MSPPTTPAVPKSSTATISSSQSTSSTPSTSLAKPTPAPSSASAAISYLLRPSSQRNPTKLRFHTRALLRTLHYTALFVFWRLVRYAKYFAVGSVVAALGATAAGSVASGVAFVVAPPSLGAAIGVGIMWGAGKWGVRRWGRRMEREREREGRVPAQQRQNGGGGWDKQGDIEIRGGRGVGDLPW